MKISPLLSLVGLVPSSLREQGNLLMTNVCVPIAVYVSINVNVPINVNAPAPIDVNVPIHADVPIAVYVSVDVVGFHGRNTRCCNRIRDGARDIRKIQLVSREIQRRL